MLMIGATGLILNDIPVEAWVWAAFTLFITAALGFATGVFVTKMSARWALRRASKSLTKLFDSVGQSIDHAQQACSLLDKFPGLALSAKQIEGLDSKRGRLLDTLARIVEKTQKATVEHVERKVDGSKKPKTDEPIANWVREPVDAGVGVPERSAFDANLAMMLEFATEADVEHGLLLIKVDKFEQHLARFGADGARKFLKRMATVLVRAIRDDDVVCRYSPDTFGVLIPNVNEETGKRIALAIRDSVKNHHFRLEESGPEVLVTASFGYARCRPHDNFDLALNRAGNALAGSKRKGRNQLHVHDGNLLKHCQTQ